MCERSSDEINHAATELLNAEKIASSQWTSPAARERETGALPAVDQSLPEPEHLLIAFHAEGLPLCAQFRMEAAITSPKKIAEETQYVPIDSEMMVSIDRMFGVPCDEGRVWEKTSFYAPSLMQSRFKL